MPVELTRVDYSDRPVLRNLTELYLYDFSVYNNDDVNKHGLYNWSIDWFFTDSDRHPFFIMVDGMYAGFVILRNDLAWIAGEGTHDMMEFFVMRKYRGRGIGREAAIRSFNRFPGCWEVRILMKNTPAQGFWKQVINGYTSGNYREEFINIPEAPGVHDWHGPAFYFNTPSN